MTAPMTAFPPFISNGDADPGDPRGPGLRDIPLRMIWPNLITVLAICAGLTGVRLAVDGDFSRSVMLVLLAAFLDGIDGRVARALKATSKFGAQMDSLADIVNFGAAPALVVYMYLLDHAGSFGWIAALIYAIACGLRLARFNVMLENPGRAAWQSEYFVGVPAPAGAILVLLPVYLGLLGVEAGRIFALAASFYTIAIGVLLVSRLPVWSGKALGQKVPRDSVMPIMLLIVLAVLFLASYTWQALVVIAFGYLVSLPFSTRAYIRRSVREEEKRERETAGDGETDG